MQDPRSTPPLPPPPPADRLIRDDNGVALILSVFLVLVAVCAGMGWLP